MTIVNQREVKGPFLQEVVLSKVMKKLSCILIFIWGFVLLVSCIEQNNSVIKEKSDSIASLKKQVAILEQRINLLEFPASDRIKAIKDFVESEKYDEALSGIRELKEYFPKSAEIEEANNLIKQIEAKKQAIEEEKQRIRALGFKALTIVQKTKIGSNDISFSNCKVGLKFIHDVYPTYSGSSWFEHTADKGSKYISFNMDVTSTDKNPNIPTVAFYSIDGGSLIYRSTFWVLFARWDDYGSYLGNEPDLKNDFSKVNTVKFRVGIEIDDEYLNKPYMVVLKKENTQVRNYDKYRNPPVYYNGDAGYPGVLDIEDFNKGEYIPIKIENLK